MASKGWTLGLALVGLALLFVVVGLAATPAGASITGVQPPATGDWDITQDTTVLGETIKIVGDINVYPGYTLRIRNSQILINSSYEGDHGIAVDANATHNGTLELEDTSIRSDYSPYGWWFDVLGNLMITDNVRLYDVQDGIWIHSDGTTIDDLELHAQGRFGIYVNYGDPTITDTDIMLEVNPGSTGTGLAIYGSSSDRAAPRLDDVRIRVSSNDRYETTSTSVYTRFYLYGMECYYAQFDTLQNIDISFEATAHGLFNTTGTPYMRVYFYTYALTLSSGTMVNGFNNVTISDSNYFVDADAERVQNGYLYMYTYWYGFRNYIASNGRSPDVFSGVSIRNQRLDWDDNNIFTTSYRYYYGRGIEWSPSPSAMSATENTFNGIIVDNIEIERMVEVTNALDFRMLNCEFWNSYIDDYFMYYWNNDIVLQKNMIINCTMLNNYYFYIYQSRGTIEFIENNMSYNTYYYFLRTYYNYAKVLFEDNLIMGNKQRPNGAYTMFYIYYMQSDITFDGNNITGNDYNYMYYLYYPYYNLELINNEFSLNSGNNYWMYSYYIRADLELKDNLFFNNSFSGGFIYAAYNYADYVWKDNEFIGNQLGSNGLLFCYGYHYSGFDITGNHFEDNTGAGRFFDFFGLGYTSTISFRFELNEFYNNTASTASNGGLVYFFKVRQTLAVRDNLFVNNSANCIVFSTPYYYGYYTQAIENHWFYVEDNQFYNNSGKSILFEQIDNNHIQIMGNTGSGNEDYCVWLFQKNDKQYIYGSSDSGHYTGINCYYNAQGPDTLIVENNNFSYNPGGGLFLSTSQIDTAPSATYYPWGNPNQVVRVKKNMLMGNGPDGWSLGVDMLYSKPSVKNNRMDNSSMGEFWGLAPDTQANPFDMEFRDLVLDGGPEGMTAYGFSHVDADFYDCSFSNYRECLYAKGCEVNVYWSAVPEASGKTEENGKIYIWNHLEIWVTWANASGVDSGVPVPRAVVALLGSNGDYFGALQTDHRGRLEPMIITPWTSVDGVMNAWSPFQATILVENVSTAHEIHVVGDFINEAPYSPMGLVLVDWSVPEVIISNPQDGTLVNTPDVLGEGFLFEIGSGITVFEGRTDVMAEDVWEPISENVLWQHVFYGLGEGEHDVSVRAMDLSRNWNTSTVHIIVDLTNPSLAVHLEYLNATRIPYNETMGGYFVHGKEIAINGTYGDNFADPRDIVVRINGVWEYIFEINLGKIYKRIRLDQGINTLIIDATDTAGNRATVRQYVSLDSIAPSLYIYYPLQNQVTQTANETMLVTGLSERNTLLIFKVVATAGERYYTSTAGYDGNFEFPVDLFEGVQIVLVYARDSAGNEVEVLRDVELDTTPPDFEITAPTSEWDITNQVRYVVMGRMTREQDADVYIKGQWVPNPGVFQRTVVLEEGANVIDIMAIDKVGNEQVKYVTIVRDTVRPVMEVTSPEGDFLLTREQVIEFRGTVAGAEGVTIEHRSIEFTATIDTDGTWSYDLELGPNDLDQYIVVRAFDEAGNEVFHTLQVVLDIIIPGLSIDPFPDETSVDWLDYLGKKYDPETGGTRYYPTKAPIIWINGTTDGSILEVFVQGVKYQVEDGRFHVQWSLTAGPQNINIEVLDEAGNSAQKEEAVYYQYKAPPSTIGDADGDGKFSSIWGIALLIAAIVVIATAFMVTGQRTRRR